MPDPTADEFTRAEEAAQFVLARTPLRPRIGVVLGSGFGAFAGELRDAAAIPYEGIPHFPRSTAIGHAGRLVLGSLDNLPLAVMQGRVHLYEGYTAQQVVFPVRVLARMGVRAVVLTNAAGGINPELDAARWCCCGITSTSRERIHSSVRTMISSGCAILT
jgi:purine-nucleoside phosphorylase